MPADRGLNNLMYRQPWCGVCKANLGSLTASRRETRMSATKRTMLCAGLCLGILDSGCRRNAVRQEQAGPEVRTTAVHWVHDAKLREIMARLDREMAASWPQEIEAEYTTPLASRRAARALEEACWLAEELVRAADAIPEAIRTVKLAEDERQLFVSQARTLREQAEHLQVVAGRADVTRMHATLTDINETCQACHERFREVSGPLRSR